MQISVYVGGKAFLVDEAILLNFLVRNGVEAGAPNTVVREVVDKNETGRILLNEQERF